MNGRHPALIGLTFVLGCAELSGQASFACANHDLDAEPHAVVDAPVYDWAGNLLAGPQYRAELYGGASPDSLSPVVDYYDQTRAIVPFFRPGYFFSTRGTLSVLDVPPFGWAWLQVKVWDTRLGATYEDAAARGLGGYGQSELFRAQGGAPNLPVPTDPAPLIGLQSFYLLQGIPEPPTWGLLLLGGILLWWRRTGSGRT
jgi:hypothetical protein